MKGFLTSFFYYVGATAWTYVFHWVLVLWIYGVRFIAADGPPGDIGISSKLVYSVGFPLFNFILMTGIFLVYRLLLNNVGIEVRKAAPIFFNIVITAILIWRVVNIVFD